MKAIMMVQLPMFANKLRTSSVKVPSFVGSNYFCDTGSQEHSEFSCLYHEAVE